MAKTTDVSTTKHQEDRFTVCLPNTIHQEVDEPKGGWSDWTWDDTALNFSDDPGDPGGKTYCGIIQSEYDSWRKAHGLALQDVRDMTQAEGYAIYRSSYWQPHCVVLAPGLDMQFFDASVNQGGEEATKILQVALGIANDGIWGPQTAARAQGVNDVKSAIQAFTARRLVVYRETKGFQDFGNDWTRRANEIGAEALNMAA